MARSLRRLRLFAFFALTLSPLAYAAPLDDRIPQDALFYAGWQGADALAPQYANSNLKGMVDASGLGAYVAQQLPNWIAMAGQSDPAAAARIQMAMSGLGILWHHSVAVYVGPADFSNPKAPQFRAALLCDAGNDANMLAGLLAFAQSAAPPEAHVVVTTEGGLVMLTVGLSAPDQFQAHAATSLASLPAYAHALQQVGGTDGALTMYNDPQKFFAMIDKGVEGDATVKPEDRAKYRAVVDALGLRSLTPSAYRGGFKDKEWAEGLFIGASGAHTGLLALLDGAPLDPATLAVIPQEAYAFSAGRLDISKILPLARDIAGRIDPRALATLNQGIAQANQQLGFDLEKDFFAALGDAWVVYRGASPDGVGLASTLVHKLKDGDRFAKTLTAIEGQINEKGGGRVEVESTDADGFKVSAVETPAFSVAWTVRNGYFYLSTLGAISAAINQVEKHPADITTNATYKAVRAALPDVKATAVEFTEPAKLYPEEYRALSSVLPMLRMMKVDLPLRVVPSPAKAAPFLAPGGSVSWTDEEGFHFASHSSFPGAAMGGGQADKTPSGVAMGTGPGPAASPPARAND